MMRGPIGATSVAMSLRRPARKSGT